MDSVLLGTSPTSILIFYFIFYSSKILVVEVSSRAVSCGFSCGRNCFLRFTVYYAGRYFSAVT